MNDSARITLACLDLAGTSVTDGGVLERAFADALATQGIVPGTEAYGHSMAKVHAGRGRSKLAIFREVFSDDDRARAANHSFERAYDSIIDRVGLTPVPGAEAALDKLAGSGVQVCLMTGFGRATLGRVIDTLGWWGLRHAWRWPRDGEPLHAEHLLRAAIQAIDLATGDHEPARWHFRLDGADYLAESDGHRWSLTATAPPAPADVIITATTQSLAALIFAGSDPGIDITGKPGAVQRFRQLIGALATAVHPA